MVLLTTFLSAQKAKPILGIAKENKPISYYKEQSLLWQARIKEYPKDGLAWRYYYLAERAIAQLSDLTSWNNDKTEILNKLKPLIARGKKAMGNSFDYYCLEGMNALGDQSTAFFEKAYAIDPDRPEAHGWLFSKYVPKFKTKDCQDLASKMLQNNVYSNANLMWNYNALQSAAPNSIFIANADMDCIPKWTLQYGQGIRTDVLVISKWLMVDDLAYRSEVLKRIGIDGPDKDLKDFNNATEFVDYLTAYIIRNSPRSVYTSSGTDINFLKAHNLQDDMYVVGAALQYSKSGFDNVETIRNNFEEKYQLEYLFLNFQHHAQDEVIKTQMNITYLPALFTLKEYYSKTKDTKKLAYCNKLIDKIAEDSGRKESVLSWFN